MTNAGLVGFPGANPDPRYAPRAAYPAHQSGYYYFASSQATQTTTATLTNGTLRVSPCIIPTSLFLSRLGAEVQTTGDSGCLFRIGVYADDGTGYPGRLVLDAGTIAGDSATVQEITVSVPLSAGLYWFGGAVQSVTTTQPTLRVTSNWQPPVPIRNSSSFAAAGVALGHSQASVTGALPAVFTTTVSVSGSMPRIFLKVA